MKKVIGYSLLVVVLSAMVAGPAMAGQGRGGGGGSGGAGTGGCVFALVGEVTEVDAGTQRITVTVFTGNHLVKDWVDKELKVTTTEDTRFRRYGDPECVFIAFGDVELGAYVSVWGCVAADEFVAERITVDASVECLQ